MKVYQTNEIKNIALVGSAGSGKTTLAESMLYGSGIIKRRGTVEQHNTVSDYFSRGAGIWVLRLSNGLPCGMEQQEAEYYRLSGLR